MVDSMFYCPSGSTGTRDQRQNSKVPQTTSCSANLRRCAYKPRAKFSKPPARERSVLVDFLYMSDENWTKFCNFKKISMYGNFSNQTKRNPKHEIKKKIARIELRKKVIAQNRGNLLRFPYCDVLSISSKLRINAKRFRNIQSVPKANMT